MLKTVSSITNAIGALNFKGTWNATANTPALASGVGTKGDYYVVGTAGSTTLDGISNWGIGDWAAFNGTVWQRVEGGADLNGVNLLVSGNSTLSGLLLVGASSASFGEKFNLTAGNQNGALIKNTQASENPILVWNSSTTGDAAFIAFATETSYAGRGTINYNRGAGLVAYNTTSDYRAKDIFGPVVDSGAVIDSVPVYMGKMKGAAQTRPMFIAHETPEYAHSGVKDAVDADGKPVFQQMDASALIPVMWAEIQSLRARVAQIESK